jgi:ketosteroid isomerase-like protein
LVYAASGINEGNSAMNDKNYIPGLVQALLTAIDHQDWESLSKLLSADTIYEVSGFPRFEEKSAVMDYYENTRPIKSGIHTIESIITDGDRGVCCGHFVGVKKDGESVDLLFADEISFENLKIKQRRVYFCQPEY